MTAALTADGICKSYGKGRLLAAVLRDVSLSVEAGEAVALMGPSGCGKSTLLDVLGLMSAPDSGMVRVVGQDVGTTERARARLRNEMYGYVHQSFAIIDDESVARNVQIPLEYRVTRVSRKERRERVAAALGAVDMEWAIDKRPSQLSGGERQRVAIARAIISNPDVILADEPTAALDSNTADTVMTTILDLRHRGTAVLIATHDPLR